MQSQQSVDSEASTSSGRSSGRQTPKNTRQRLEDTIENSAAYIGEQLETVLDDYRTLERMNAATAKRYAEMRKVASTVRTCFEAVNNHVSELRPQIEKSIELHERAKRLEQAAYQLDSYVKALEARLKAKKRS